MQFQVVPVKKLGLAYYAVISGRSIVATFLSEAGARDYVNRLRRRGIKCL